MARSYLIISLLSLIAASYTAEEEILLWRMGKEGKVVNVPYVLDANLNSPSKNLIKQALDEIQKATCIRFFVRNGQKDFVHFKFRQTLGSGTLGRKGGEQFIYLSPFGSMNKERPQHEMFHTLGFNHQHQRFDRDKHVKIIWENIPEKNKFAFKRYENQKQVQGTPYDYDSLLHYPRDSFSKNGQDTIVTIDTLKQNSIGHQRGPSKGDYLRINRMYNCPGFEKWSPDQL